MKELRQTFTNSEFAELKAQKGDRTWHEAILDEFDVEPSEEDEEDA